MTGLRLYAHLLKGGAHMKSLRNVKRKKKKFENDSERSSVKIILMY